MISKLYQIFQKYPTITIDSRDCPPNSIFFALKGEKSDGNKYAAAALEAGCSYAVVDNKNYAKGDKYFLVEDALATLQELARIHRQALNVKILAITGTNGKTTTKELVASVMSKKYKILYTQENYNNHIGVPLTLLRLTNQHEFGIIEMGANHINEIEFLTGIVQPNYGLITNFGIAHTEGFGSLENIIKTKTELFDYLRTNKGFVFVNKKDEKIIESAQGILDVSYGINENRADVSGYITEQKPCVTVAWSSIRFSVSAQIIKTNLIGEYNLENLLAAITVGLFFEVETNDINSAIAEYEPHNLRSQWIKSNAADLIVDTYNANPSSMEAAIKNFAKLSFDRKALFLGDMLELGDISRDEHLKVLKLVETCNFDEIFLVGGNFAEVNSGYKSFENKDMLVEYLRKNPLLNYAILIKGSNKIGLDSLKELFIDK